jgi:hypothetical protein
MEECFDKLNKKFTKEIQKHLNNSNLNNMIFYDYNTQQNKQNSINDKNIIKENKNTETKNIDVNDFF